MFSHDDGDVLPFFSIVLVPSFKLLQSRRVLSFPPLGIEFPFFFFPDRYLSPSHNLLLPLFLWLHYIIAAVLTSQKWLFFPSYFFPFPFPLRLSVRIVA